MTSVTSWFENILKKHIDKCLTMDVTLLSLYEFHVHSIDMSTKKKNLETKTCSYHEFDIDRYPCIHAVAACKFRNI